MIAIVGTGRGAGFFDVDETLVADKTMFSFLRFYLERRRERPGTYDAALRRLRQAGAAGASRATVNRMYYRLYAGESVRDLERAGREWAAQQLTADSWLPAAEHARAFVRAGALTALISGSFFAALDPIGDRLGADEVRGAPLHIRRGALTGDMDEPMLGERKARELRELCTRHGIARENTVAYGDHTSDLPMLEAAAHAVVAGQDAELAGVATARGWARLAPRGVRPMPVAA